MPAPTELSPYAVLDALSANVAILDETGTIIAVNAAWRQFAEANFLQTPQYGIGLNYLAVCEAYRGTGGEEATLVADGIREVMSRQRGEFDLEYACHGADEQLWFIVRVTRFDS